MHNINLNATDIQYDSINISTPGINNKFREELTVVTFRQTLQSI